MGVRLGLCVSFVHNVPNVQMRKKERSRQREKLRRRGGHNKRETESLSIFEISCLSFVDCVLFQIINKDIYGQIELN